MSGRDSRANPRSVTDAPSRSDNARELRYGETGKDFYDRVFPREMEDIEARRAALRERQGVRASSVEGVGAVLDRAPTTHNHLVGLALSGGGMRSAAFNLGVLQALESHGFLAQADYLSTVSGGGWIGSCWSALTREPGAKFPFSARDAEHGAVLNHLRDRSSALVPSGLVSGAGLLAQFIRGIGATVVLLLPLAGALALLSLSPMMWLLEWHERQPGEDFDHPEIASFLVVTRYLTAAALAWFVASVPINSLVRSSDRARRLIERSYRLAVLGVMLLATLEVQPYVVLRWHAFTKYWSWQSYGDLALHMLSGLIPLAAAWPLIPRVMPIARGLVLSIAMGMSLLAPYLIYIHLTTSFVRAEVFEHGPERAWYVQPEVWEYVALMVLYAFTDVNVFSMHDYFRDRLVRTFVLRQAPGDEVEPHDDLRLSALNLPGSVAPLHILNTTLNLHASTDRTLRGRNGSLFVFTKNFVGSSRTGYCPTALYEKVVPRMGLGTAMAISASAVSPNMGSMTIRPLVFLMTFMNLRMGYWLPHPTRLQKWADDHDFKVGEGISHTFRQLMNARLAWMPRLGCFLRELGSVLHERGSWVFLSDGGHLENTGAYELLRRRCKFIIVSDAEEDGRMQFGGIASLMRRARIDFGIEITLDLDDLRPDARGRSRKHTALGTVLYPARNGVPNERGQMLYIKSSITGHESEIIAQYRAINQDFPHQSTANQAFSEAQFEAYRALGDHITREVCELRDPSSGDSISAWFDELRQREEPGAEHLEEMRDLRDEREEVETLLRDPACAGYFAELYPELAVGTAPAAVLPAVLHQAVMRQIHLMASVHARLRLDTQERYEHPWNKGWISLFLRWSRAPGFRRVWLVAAHSMGAPFRRFCADALMLRIAPRWSIDPRASRLTERGGTVAMRCVVGVSEDALARSEHAVAEAQIEVDRGVARMSANVLALTMLPGADETLSVAQAQDALYAELRKQGLKIEGEDDLPNDPRPDPTDWLRQAKSA